MPTNRDHASVRWLLLGFLVLSKSAGAADAGTGKLLIESDGAELRIRLEGPALNMVGFERAPENAAERETLSLAAENLHAGEAMIRLPSRAGCRLEHADVDADPARNGGGESGNLGAGYRFRCDAPDELDSVAIGVFAGFPFLTRIHAHYRIGAIRGEGLLTPANPLLHLIPLQ